MATATKSQNKTSFVKDFLKVNPKGNAKAVNEAWAAAGMTGTIGATLVNKMRSDLGLTGNLRATSKPKTAAKTKSATKISKKASSPGKSMFVKEFLNDHPQSNVDTVIDAWQAAGFDGTISATLVNKMRAMLGLTGNLRGTPRTSTNGKATSTGKKAEDLVRRPPLRQRATTRSTVHSPERTGSRHRSADFQGDGDWRSHRDRGFVETGETAALRSDDRRLTLFDPVTTRSRRGSLLGVFRSRSSPEPSGAIQPLVPQVRRIVLDRVPSPGASCPIANDTPTPDAEGHTPDGRLTSIT